MCRVDKMCGRNQFNEMFYWRSTKRSVPIKTYCFYVESLPRWQNSIQDPYSEAWLWSVPCLYFSIEIRHLRSPRLNRQQTLSLVLLTPGPWPLKNKHLEILKIEWLCKLYMKKFWRTAWQNIFEEWSILKRILFQYFISWVF